MLTANSNRSQQIQIAHSKLQIARSKFKSLTANSNRSQQITNCSQQIQIAHSKFKSLTANYKLLTANYKSLTANSNRAQQIKVTNSKFKSLLSLPFCRGSRVFFRVSRVHCRGSLFYTEKLWKSVKRINIELRIVCYPLVSVLIRVYCRHATLLDCGTTIILAWINLLNKLTNSTLPSNSWPKYRRTRLLSSWCSKEKD